MLIFYRILKIKSMNMTWLEMGYQGIGDSK